MKYYELKAEDRAELKKDGYTIATFNKNFDITGIFREIEAVKVDEISGLLEIWKTIKKAWQSGNLVYNNKKGGFKNEGIK